VIEKPLKKKKKKIKSSPKGFLHGVGLLTNWVAGELRERNLGVPRGIGQKEDARKE